MDCNDEEPMTPHGPDNGGGTPLPSASGAWEALLASTLAVVSDARGAMPGECGAALDTLERLFQGLAKAALSLEEQLAIALQGNATLNAEVALLRKNVTETVIAAREAEARWHEAEMRERSAVEKLRQAHRVTDLPAA